MNQEQRKLQHLRDRTIGARMQLDLIESDLLAVERDIEFLNKVRDFLIENIEVLKSSGIIAIASEYRKARDEFATVKENLRFYTELHTNLLKDFDKYKRIYEICLSEFEEFKKELDSRRVVLDFNLDRKKK